MKIQGDLRLGTDAYKNLREYEQKLTNLLEEYFDDKSTIFNPGHICKKISQYSANIHPMDKYTNDAMDFCEKFRRVRSLNFSFC